MTDDEWPLANAVQDHLNAGGVNWGLLADGNAYHWNDATGKTTLVGPVGTGWGCGHCDPGNRHRLVGDWCHVFTGMSTSADIADAMECAEILARRP